MTVVPARAGGPAPRALLAVAAGGLLGGAARVGSGLLGEHLVGAVPAWAVLVLVNLLGCFAMGAVSARGGRLASPAVTTGLLGGFTSFSGWVLDALRLLEPAPVLAVALLLAVPVAAVAACVAGLVAGGERP